MNKSKDIQEMKILLEKELDTVAIKAIKNNPLDDTPFAGYPLMSVIMDSGNIFKEAMQKNKTGLGLTETQIDEMVKEVVRKILKKYITNI